MKYDVVSSGSKGNATLIFSHGEVLLIDFGISKKRIEKALAGYGHGFDDIEAFFVTHDHSDHASGIFNAPIGKVFAGVPSLPKMEHSLESGHLVKPFETKIVGRFKVTSVPLSHDAKNTLGYVIDDGEESLVYLTDTGFVPEKDYPYIQGKTYYIFESNHDPEMLFNSKRPDYLIRRIISDKGHLSNADSAYYLSNLIGEHTEEIVLAHLSSECNTPEIAMSTYEAVMQAQLGFLPEVLLRCGSETKETKGGKDE